MFRSERFVAAFGAIALSLSAMAADAPSYEASRIDLPDAYRPGAINRHGDMAGIKRLDVQARWGQEQLGFRLIAGEAPKIFADLSGGDRHAAWLDINDAGLAVGYGTVTGKADRGFVDYGAPNGARARIVGPSGEAISLEPVLGEGVDSVAFAVNRYGTVAGEIFLWRPDGHESAKPFVWSDDAGVRFPFGNDDPSDPVSVGALNDHGQLAGVRSVTHGYVWDPEKGVLEFGTTAGIREVRALNNHGQAIGRDIFDKVFVWQRADGLRYLPPLKPNGEHKCIANDIDDRGWIVGVCQYVPTLWIPDEAGAYRAVNLATRTVPVDGSVDGHFDWSEAIRIGEDGRILVWTYIAEYPGYQDEPSISLLLAPIASP